MRAFLQELTAPPAQTLRTLQPTPTTVSYTISTRPIPRSVTAVLVRYIGILVRLAAGLAVALLLRLKWIATDEMLSSYQKRILGPIEELPPDSFATALQWRYLAPAALVVLFLVFKRNYTEESLTVLRGLGIQTSTTSSTYLQTPTTRFIPTTSIQDILIHEAFKGFEVIFYLVVVVEGEEDVVVVFPRLLPRRVVLEEVWRGARKCLWDGKDEVERGEHNKKGKEDSEEQ